MMKPLPPSSHHLLSARSVVAKCQSSNRPTPHAPHPHPHRRKALSHRGREQSPPGRGR